MKKLMILALAALVVFTVFAETDPAFSGSFSTYFRYAIDEKEESKRVDDDYSISAAVKMNATIDEWNSVSAEFETKDAAYLDPDHIDKVRYIKNKTDYLRLKDFSITTDVTGAFGLGDLPVQLSMKTGKQEFKAISVAKVAPVSTEDADGGKTSKNIGFVFDLKVMDMVTISSHLFPKHLLNNADGTEAGVTIKATDIKLGPVMLDVAAFGIWSESNFGPNKKHKDNYKEIKKKEFDALLTADQKNTYTQSYTDKDKYYKLKEIKEGESFDEIDDNKGVDLGFSIAAKLLDSKLKIGLGVVSEEPAPDNKGKNKKSEIGFQTDVSYTMDKLTAGVSFGASNINELTDTASVIVAANYDFFTALGVYAALEYPFKKDSKLNFDFGINTAIKALAVQVGFTNNLEYKAPEDDWENTAFIKFSTSF